MRYFRWKIELESNILSLIVDLLIISTISCSNMKKYKTHGPRNVIWKISGFIIRKKSIFVYSVNFCKLLVILFMNTMTIYRLEMLSVIPGNQMIGEKKKENWKYLRIAFGKTFLISGLLLKYIGHVIPLTIKIL